MDFNELRAFWAASSEAASNQGSVHDAEHGRHGGHEQTSVSENADSLAGAERGVSLVADVQVHRNSVRKSLDISELAGLFGCDELQVCQQISLDGGNHEPSCGNDIEDENRQENDRNMDQIITQQALSQGEQDIVPAVGSGRLLHDVDEEEGERQNNNAGVGRRQTSNTGRGMKALSPSINKPSSPVGSDAQIEGSPFPVLGVRTVKSSRASRKAWQALPSVVTWTGRLKTYEGSRGPREQDSGLRVDVFYDILNVAARDWTAAVNSIGFWADSVEQKTTSASSPGFRKQDVESSSRSAQNRPEFLVESHPTSGFSCSVRDSLDCIDQEEEKRRLLDRLKQIAQERMLHEQRDERQQEQDLLRLIQAARQREERGVEIKLQSYDLMMTSRSEPHPHRQQKSGALSIVDFLSSPLSKSTHSEDTTDEVTPDLDSASGKSEVAGAALFGAFNNLPAIPPLVVPPVNLNIPRLDTLSSSLSPSKPGLKSMALKSVENNPTQSQSPLQVWSSRPSVVSWNLSGQQPSQSTSEASLKYFSKLRVTKVTDFDVNTVGSRGSARSNDTSSSHHSEKDLSTPSDTASVAQENAARLTTHKLAAENDTHSCSPSRVQQSELDAAKSAQDAATAANAAALEAKAALAQAQAEAQEIIRQSKFQADQMIKQAQEAAEQQAAAAEDILKRAEMEAQKITNEAAVAATATLAEATAKNSGHETDTHPLLPMFEVNFSLDSDPFMTRQQSFSAQKNTQQNEQRDVSRAISLATSLLEQGDETQTDRSEEESSMSSTHSNSREAGQLIESSVPVSYGGPFFSDAPTQNLILPQQTIDESIEENEKQSAEAEERVTLDIRYSGDGGGGNTAGKEGFEEVAGAGAWGGEGKGGLGHFGHDADILSQFEELDRIMASEQPETPQSLHQIVDTYLGSEHHILPAAADLAEEDDTSPHALVPGHTDDGNLETSPFGTPVSRFETPGRQEPVQDMWYSDAGGTDGSMQKGVQGTEYSGKNPLDSALNPLDSACSRRRSDAVSEDFPTWATPAARTPNIPLTARVEGWGDFSLRNMLLLPRTPQPLMFSASPGGEEIEDESSNVFHALQFPKLPDLPPLQIGGNVNLQIELPEPRVPELPPVFDLSSVESFTASVETFTPSSAIANFGDTPQKSKNREEVMAAIGEAQKDFGKLIGQAGSAIVSMLALPAVGNVHELSSDAVPVRDANHRVSSPQRSPDGVTAKGAEDPASFSTPSADRSQEGRHETAVSPRGLPDAVPIKDADDPVSSSHRSPDGVTAKEAEDPASFSTPSADRSQEEGHEEILGPKRHVIRNWKVPANGFARGTFLRCQDKGNTGWFDPEILPSSVSRQAEAHDAELSARSTYSTHWVDDAATGEKQNNLEGTCIGETPVVQQALCEVHQSSCSSPSPAHAEASAVCPPAQMEQVLQHEFERRGLSTLVDVFVEYGIQQLEEMITLLRTLTEQDFQEGSDFLSEIAVPLTRFQIRILRYWWREIMIGDGRPSHSI